MERIMRGRKEADASGFGRKIQGEVDAKLVRQTRMRVLAVTGILEKSRTWLCIEKRNGIPADTLTSPTEESLSCAAELVSELVMLDTDAFPRKK